MGLDITAYRAIGKRLCTIAEYQDDATGWQTYRDTEERWRTTVILCNDDFPERSNGIVSGLYELPEGVEPLRFSAGAYSGYNDWRRSLCQLARGLTYDAFWALTPTAQVGPFWELLAFADNEGFLGPETCARLVVDFEAYEPAALEAFDWYEYRLYTDFQRACRLAAGAGVVVFC